jgi:hypothetical protein
MASTGALAAFRKRPALRRIAPRSISAQADKDVVLSLFTTRGSCATGVVAATEKAREAAFGCDLEAKRAAEERTKEVEVASRDGLRAAEGSICKTEQYSRNLFA